MNDADTSQPPRGLLREVLARDGLAMGVLAAATLAAELGVYAVGRFNGAGARESLLAALAAIALWVCLAGPCAAAGGKTVFSRLLRGAVVVDATAVSLLIIWLIQPDAAGGLTFAGAVKVYCVCISVASAGCLAVGLTTKPARRAMVAVLAGVVMVAALASPFWISAHVGAGQAEVEQALVTWAVRINPFYAICDAVVYQTRYVWHGGGLIYELTRVGGYVNPSRIAWWRTCLLYIGAAVVLAAINLIYRAGCVYRNRTHTARTGPDSM
jgi:hypothetical protein